MSYMPEDVDIKRIHGVIKNEYSISLFCGNEIYLIYNGTRHAEGCWNLRYEGRWLKEMYFTSGITDLEYVKDPNEGGDIWFRVHFKNKRVTDEMRRIENEISKVMFHLADEPWDEYKEPWDEFRARRLKETIKSVKVRKQRR